MFFLTGASLSTPPQRESVSCTFFSSNLLIFYWSLIGVMVSKGGSGGGKVFSNLIMTSQSFRSPVCMGYNLHKYLSSCIDFISSLWWDRKRRRGWIVMKDILQAGLRLRQSVFSWEVGLRDREHSGFISYWLLTPSLPYPHPPRAMKGYFQQVSRSQP